MDDHSLLRYSRHLLLNEIGIEGQARIARSAVLQVGAGGLGSPAAIYLVASGIGRLLLLDDDVVELTNLQRQILHASARVGHSKVDSAAVTLRALNPQVQVDVRRLRAGPETIGPLLAGIDVVLDCSDNGATRHALNRACRAAGVPLVLGAANAFAGQLVVFDFREADAPCYACLFPEGAGEDEACATTGIFAPLAGVMGAMQAGEALKLLAGAGPSRSGSLLVVDGLDLEFRRLRFARNPNCTVCGTGIACAS